MIRRVVLSLFATAALNTLIAVVLHAVGYSRGFAATFVQSQAIGLSIAAACWAVVPWVERAQGAARVSVPLFAAALAVGVLGGMQLATLATRLAFPETAAAIPPGRGPLSVPTALLSLAIGVAGTLVVHGRERLRHERTRAEVERWRALAAERSAAHAQLQALRAQVEPHFLFNTLANVSALIDRDPAAARSLVDDLARHLRATLRHARAGSTTLGEELDVTASLLSIMQRRLGGRLAWRFDVPEALRGEPVPPMLVQPLVENAVKHGIEPAVGGGEIEVRAHRGPDGSLVVEVADTGEGLEAAQARASGHDGGLGLENLADRLRAIYGPGARLALRDNPPRGTVARLVLPARRAEAA